MFAQNVRNLTSHSNKIQTSAGTLRKQNTKLACEFPEKVAVATVESAWLKTLTKKLASLKSKLALSRVGGLNSWWSDHNISNGLIWIENDK